jgi:putative membrane-bound dehydrogenase-like protein
LALLACAAQAPRSLSADDSIPLQVPPGFVITQFADDRLAHDIFCMTVDSLGRIAVSGPGYVRILIDADHDGIAESFKTFAEGPATGAQGMYFLGRDLLCIGDAGLIRYRDADGDDRADGPPDVFLKIKTGGEHHAHAIQKGPDGWWHLIVGNDGGVSQAYVTLPTSPIKSPHAGTLMRLKPDLSGGEIVLDGMRNAYDFAFNARGDLFVFDSDSEREVSLPWYRPTRVLHALPGSDAGWVSQSWIRPDHDLDMPPVIASFGRGSPTGVVCYRHTQFPADYQGALFVLDWNFGRVLAVPLAARGGTWSSTPHTFITGKGQFGFAPTDVEVGPDGSLYVCVGGRGTRGGVYRVSYGHRPAAAPSQTGQTDGDLSRCLAAAQPLSSWSRAAWLPLAKSLGREAFLAAAHDGRRDPAERCRAIEIVTELFGGLDAAALGRLAADPAASVRARAVWSAGRSADRSWTAASLKPFVDDADPAAARAALEALWTIRIDGGLERLRESILRRLGDGDRTVRFAAARLSVRLDHPDVLRPAGDDAAGLTAAVWSAFGHCERTTTLDPAALQAAVDVFEKAKDDTLRLEALRTMQIALGDCGPGQAKAPMFDGYTSRIDLSRHERELDPVRARLAATFPAADATVNFELARVLAMLTPFNGGLLQRVLAEIKADSDPVRDIHFLTVAARIPVDRNFQQSARVAEALIRLEPKIRRAKLNQDRNWEDRVGETYKQLVALDPDLPAAIVARKDFGRPGHVLFLSEIGPELLEPAVAAFVRSIKADPDYPWTNGVVFLLGESKVPEHRELVRARYGQFALRGAVLMALSARPEETDRTKFFEGLDSSQLEVVGACLDALDKLAPPRDAAENLALVGSIRRLRSEKPELALRERAVKLLARGAGQNFAFIFGTAGYTPQTEAIARITRWFERTYPQDWARFNAQPGGEDPAALQKLLQTVDWQAGDAGRGRKVFQDRTCAQCHGGSKALGPDLAGVAERFSRDDLFLAIVQPHRDVSPRYQTTMIQTTGGQTLTGMIVYEAVDGLILRNSANQTFRIKPDEIEERRRLKTSLMPAGLLRGVPGSDLADLDAYLRSLSASAAGTASPPVAAGSASKAAPLPGSD